jgi:hypothetical protein
MSADKWLSSKEVIGSSRMATIPLFLLVLDLKLAWMRTLVGSPAIVAAIHVVETALNAQKMARAALHLAKLCISPKLDLSILEFSTQFFDVRMTSSESRSVRCDPVLDMSEPPIDTLIDVR